MLYSNIQIHSKYQIFPDLNLVFVQRSEKFSFGAMFSTFKDILSDPDFNTGMNFLVDSQKVDYSSANYAAFSVQQEVWSSTHKKLGPCKMAFLQQDATNYGINRQASSMFFSAAVERQPFRNLCEACSARAGRLPAAS